MNEQKLRTSELDKWTVVTHICSSFERAQNIAQELLQRAATINIWPLRTGWIVVVKFHSMLN